MLKGVHLSLLIGFAVPKAVPPVVIDSLSSVQVNHDKARSGFQLTFEVSKKSSLLNDLLPNGFFDPMVTRVIIVATLNGLPNVLIDGVVTRQTMAPSSDVGQSTLTITGEDLSILMDVIEKIIPFPAMSDVAIAYALLAPYAVLGVVPLIIPPIISVVPIPTNNTESQMTTDRVYLKQLAKRNGYVFFLMPGTVPGQSIAYLGPDINVSEPQPTLSINLDAHTNVESLNFALDGLAKKISIYTVMDPITKKIPIPIPVPNVNLFKPPLGKRLMPPAKIEFSKDGAQLQPLQATRVILGDLMTNSSSVSGEGSLDVLRYGHILKSRLLVGVRGAGLAYDGMYYVDSVTHDIKHGEYKQNFTLSRDGLISKKDRLLT